MSTSSTTPAHYPGRSAPERGGQNASRAAAHLYITAGLRPIKRFQPCAIALVGDVDGDPELEDRVGLAWRLALLEEGGVLHAINDTAPDGVFALQMGRRAVDNKELAVGAVVVTDRVLHPHSAADKALVREFGRNSPSRTTAAGSRRIARFGGKTGHDVVENERVVKSLAHQFFHAGDMGGGQVGAHLDDQAAVAEIEVKQVFQVFAGNRVGQSLVHLRARLGPRFLNLVLRQRQVLVGLVMVDGWPIAHHVFAGNDRDASTVPSVLADLEQRFGLDRLVFVGDRGMITRDNLALLRAHGQGYILGRNRRRSPEVAGYIASATGPWHQCPLAINGAEKKDPPKTLVCEVECDAPGTRILVVHSDERLAFEKAEREKAMAKVARQLEALARRVAQGRLKAAHKVGAAAGRILARNHGQRYWDWSYEDGVFRYFEHPLNFERELAGEGKYVIQCEGVSLSAVDIVRLYKELSEVERGFRNLKDVIDMRPIYHQTDERVQAHIFVAALAFLLHRALEKKLKAAGIELSATEALGALKTIRVVDIDLGNGETKRCVTPGSERATRILAALGITDRNPPAPPKQDQTLM